MNKESTLILLAIFLSSFVHAQDDMLIDLQINPVVSEKWQQESSVPKLFKMASPVDVIDSLPFLDDFSKEGVYPNPALWLDRNVFINRSYPKAPLSIGVATFDGLDKTGYPYDFLAAKNSSGPADTLTSKPIRLDSSKTKKYTPADSIYFSFFYQPKGWGEAPETPDSLILEFKTSTKPWKRIWARAGFDPKTNDSIFYSVIIPITDTAYLDSAFQFRFRNYATQSGNFDHWHIDYVYLKDQRKYNDLIMEDVAFVYEASSLLKTYQAIPWEQFKTTDMNSSPNLFIRNSGTGVNNTHFEYKILDTTGTQINPNYSGVVNIDPFIQSGYDATPTTASPALNFTFPGPFKDKTFFIAEYVLNPTSFNLVKDNDTLRYQQQFQDYYAYDDGTAEFAYGLAPQTLSQLAVQFETNITDTLRGVDIFFSPTEINASKFTFRIGIWNDNGGQPGSLIYKDSLVTPQYEKKGHNKFYRYRLAHPSLLIGAGVFYVGWIQTGGQLLNVGFDYNNNFQNKIFKNTTGSWSNASYKGTVMIRPVFGRKLTPAVGIYENAGKKAVQYKVFPNPASDQIYIQKNNNQQQQKILVQISDLQGKILYSEPDFKNDFIDVSNFPAGIYFLQLQDKLNGFVETKKIAIVK